MSARILDGKSLALEVRKECRMRVNALKAQGVTPGLAVVLVGANPASRVYVNSKSRACAEVGMHSEICHLSGDASEKNVIERLRGLNEDSRIHGVIVQLPLPARLRAHLILQQVAIDKDVDGFNWCNQGALSDGYPRFVPCTPLGVLRLLEHGGVKMDGRRAVVVGRSSIVGKPLANLLLLRNATVTICHSRTHDLARETREAEILVAATGLPGLIKADMVRSGVAVVDVGINRTPEGKLVGDVEFATVSEKASVITPVPGGVGPMTVAMLIANTITAAERSLSAAH
jgi:methylenetetrahydrofolate dehydrogenase (NADP+)/methenyltetrahydrofolate cyclohydrolase